MFGSLPTRLAATVVKKVLKIFATVFLSKVSLSSDNKPIHFALLFNLVKPRDFTAFHMSVDEFLHSEILL